MPDKEERRQRSEKAAKAEGKRRAAKAREKKTGGKADLEIYFDNSATTKPSEGVIRVMTETLEEDFGNPSSMHFAGVNAEKHIRAARCAAAAALKADEREIFFTSGGTEANNIALFGTTRFYRRTGGHIITSKIEHPSVLEAVKELKKEGFDVTFLPTDENGIVSVEALRNAVRDDTVIVSVMHVNNEVGSVQDIAALSRAAKEKNPKTLFHVDATQSFGKYAIRPKKAGIDLLTASAHKIHGPKGAGLLFVKDKTKIKPVTYGGGQERGLRSGTENVSGIAGFGQAITEAYECLDENRAAMGALKDYFIDRVSEIDGAVLNSKGGADSAPHIVNVSFPGIRSEVLLHALESEGICVSAGSACSSNKPAPSETLKSMGLGKERIESALRFSFSHENTMDEIDFCVEKLKEIVPVLGAYRRH